MHKGIRTALTVLLSMLLAYVSELFMDRYPAIQTPGEHIAQREVPVPPPPNQLSTLGEKILLAFAVDSACYLVLISGLSAIIRNLRDKPNHRSRSQK
jgi:hypothetical protein